MPYEPTLEELEGIAGRAMMDALGRLHIRLDGPRYDDLHEYLVGLGCEMAATYDPAFGQAFSTYFYRRARRRVIDWLRKTHGDPRHSAGALAKLPITYPKSLSGASGDWTTDALSLAVEDPEPDSLADALVELGRGLSPDARWALVNVAGRIAEGATEYRALCEASGTPQGEPMREARRRFELLRSELESPQSPQTSENGSARASGAERGNGSTKPLRATPRHTTPLP